MNTGKEIIIKKHSGNARKGVPLIQLYNEECISGMGKRLKDASVSCVVTSPPYNLGIKYDQYDDEIPRDAYLAWIRLWAAEVKRVLHADGSLFLNIGGKPSDPMVPFEVLSVLKDFFNLQNTIHWIKSISIDKKGGSYGHYKPINSQRFLNDCHEYVFHLTHTATVPLDRKAVGVEYQDKSNIARWGSSGDGLRCRGNTWFIPYKTIQDRDSERPHPATFPVELAEMCLKLHGVERVKLALDPFLGIGSSALAAKGLNVPFIGFELDKGYFLAAENLLKERGYVV